jgi:hypothetical protein
MFTLNDDLCLKIAWYHKDYCRENLEIHGVFSNLRTLNSSVINEVPSLLVVIG